ncbi:MAG: MFS transporter [Rhodobiaceae bacterium]|nr:MFS transporter [Rhodobiaceae bacterium]
MTIDTHDYPLARASWVAFAPGIESVNVLLLYFIFAPYMVQTVLGGGADAQTIWGVVTAIGGISVALLGPITGTIADTVGGQKRFLSAFVLIAATASAALWFAVPGIPVEGLVALSIVAILLMIGVELAGVTYSSLLPNLGTPKTIGRLSGNAIGFGIAWGLILLGGYIAAFMLGDTPFFGLDREAHEHSRIAGPIVAAALLFFIMPLLAFTPPTPIRLVCLPVGRIVRGVLKDAYLAMRAEPAIARFVIARVIYQDGIGVALTFGSIYAAGLFGWDTLELAVFGICILGAAAIGATIGGQIDDRIGAKNTILLALLILIVGMIALLSFPASSEVSDGFLSTPAEQTFIGVALLLGLGIGPAGGSGRTMMARIAPQGQAGKWFGIMALAGNAVAFTGPALVALVTFLTESERSGMMVAPVIIGLGAILMLFVKSDQPLLNKQLATA